MLKFLKCLDLLNNIKLDLNYLILRNKNQRFIISQKQFYG
jgi:hypothetical protein